MPSLSSLFSNGPSANNPPCLSFHGPDKQGHIRAINSNNQEVAHFIASKTSLTRALGSNHQQICTFNRSHLASCTTIHIHGQQVKVKQTWESMQYGKDVETPTGRLTWRAGNGGYEELRDGSKTLLARGKLPGTFGSRPALLEVFVDGDEVLLDLILASWVCTI
ncbi:hypothetical protein M409DRAFT_26084 [Zasmidium cellare ATCC 36951]|uniref:Uncharacterized protein n=1 Tax=Zasmidium cellare ATCC 36951 TaxID=1080233 RepID=A0A6A6CC34_ZASCE|nr:uncharacterized protein M409DRAFT_26084 [Zasmidium cellare ATCC 36951]KAF2163472.1 hypothetical protein M409DRAFT_26084 [Zasmidium cellare ATCC 36951]